MTADYCPTLNFASKTSTRIWEEEPSQANPYLAEKCRLHGYDIFDLMKQKSFVEVLYLLFSGELPTSSQTKLLEQLMIVLINPGPRHPANRAAMTAGISKARSVHLLPIGLMVLGGEHLGAAEVAQAMAFLQTNRDKNPNELAKELLSKAEKPAEGDWHIIPGFGSRFGGIDPIPNQLADHLNIDDISDNIKWGQQFVTSITPHQMGWLSTGIAAAILLDLNIKPREGAGLFQLISAPGILAHGMEQTHHPITDMPFVEDDNYVIEEKK